MKTYKLSLIALGLALGLSACTTVGPDYKRAELNTALAVNVSHIESNFQAYDEQWWLSFSDKQLAHLVELTKKQNPSLAIAKANVKAAYALFDDVDNNQWPTGNVMADYTRAEQNPNGLRGQRSNSETYRTGVNADWQIDLFGKLARASEAAYADAQSRYYTWQDVQISMIAQVSSLYAQLSGLHEQLTVTNKNIESLSATHNIIKLRFKQGVASELDVLRIEAQVRGVEALIPELNSQISQRHNQLAALVGYAPQQLVLNFETLDNHILQQPLKIGEPKQLLRRRASLRAAEQDVIAATANIGVQTAQLYPELSMTGFLGFLSADSFNSNGENKAWSVAPTLRWSLLDRQSVKAQIAVANANQEAALATFGRAVLTVLAEAQTSLDIYNQSQYRLHSLQAQVKASERSLVLAKVQHDAGSIDLLDLLDVERTFLSAKNAFAQAKADTFTNIIEVYRSFGGSLADKSGEHLSASVVNKMAESAADNTEQKI